MTKSFIFRCSSNHDSDWLIEYDIGNKKTERMLVCNDCYSNPENPGFRLYVISKILVKESNLDQLSNTVIEKLNLKEVKLN